MLLIITPLLEHHEQQWLIDTFIWAVENFDAEFFTKHTQVILPNGTYFPDSVSSVEQMATTVFKRVVEYAGMDSWPIKLVAPQQLQPQVSLILSLVKPYVENTANSLFPQVILLRFHLILIK